MTVQRRGLAASQLLVNFTFASFFSLRIYTHSAATLLAFHYKQVSRCLSSVVQKISMNENHLQGRGGTAVLFLMQPATWRIKLFPRIQQWMCFLFCVCVWRQSESLWAHLKNFASFLPKRHQLPIGSNLSRRRRWSVCGESFITGGLKCGQMRSEDSYWLRWPG